jgi:hypothetical protein
LVPATIGRAPHAAGVAIPPLQLLVLLHLSVRVIIPTNLRHNSPTSTQCRERVSMEQNLTCLNHLPRTRTGPKLQSDNSVQSRVASCECSITSNLPAKYRRFRCCSLHARTSEHTHSGTPQSTVGFPAYKDSSLDSRVLCQPETSLAYCLAYVRMLQITTQLGEHTAPYEPSSSQQYICNKVSHAYFLGLIPTFLGIPA